MKKLCFLIIIALIFSFAIFAGGGKQAAGGAAVKGPANDAEAAMRLTNKPAESLSLPIVQDKISVTFMQFPELYVVSKMNGYGDMEIFQELEKRTNINIEWREEMGTDARAKVNLMFSTGEPEDIIWGVNGNATGGAQKVMDDGLIVPLNWYIENYAPNLKKILLENRDILKEISLADGRIFMFPMLRLDAPTRANNGLIIRKDWLDMYGLKVPTTMDEWYTVLRTFKERDPAGGGKTIPFTGLGRNSGRSWPAFGCAYGLIDGTGFYLDKGRVQHPALAPAYRDYITTMAKWYAEGLMDPEYVSITQEMVDAKMTGDIAGASYNAMAGGLGRYLGAKYRPGESSYDLVAVPNPLASDGKYYTNAGAMRNLANAGASIGVNNKYIVEITKWMDYFYTPEGQLLTNYGIEGRSYTMKNGVPTFTDLLLKNPDGLTVEEAAAKYAGGTLVNMPGFSLEGVTFQLKNAYAQQTAASQVWGKSDIGLLMPTLFLPDAYNREAGPVMSEVRTYMDEMINKFVMGMEPLSNYDRFVSTIKDMGVEKIRGYYQETYDKWLQD